jgi:IPT/TIG domain-containing protein
MKLLTVLLLCTVAVGCGYGSQATMPASAGTMPVINALNPSMANHGDPAFSLMVNGSSFTSGAYVTFNGAKMSTSWTNSGLVTAMIPQSSIVTAGNVQVTVTNPAVGGGVYGGGTRAETSSPMTFTIN